MGRQRSAGSAICKAAVVALLMLAPAVASAQTDAAKKQAQALQVDGLRLLQKGDNRGALEKFDEAFRLVQSPKILFNRGKAHRALGENAEALADFERFLDEAPFAPKESRAEASRVVDALRPALSYIEIQTDDVGSQISLDGRELGAAPLGRPAVVVPGSHEIRVAKPGMAEDVRSVSPIAGQKLRVVVKLMPAADTTPAAPVRAPIVAPVPAPAPSPAAAPVISKEASAPAQPTAGRPWQITAAWIAGGAGVAFLAGGVTAQVLSASKNAEFNDVKNAPNSTGQCNKLLAGAGGGPCQGLLDAADRRQTFAIVGYVAAGLALAGSVILYVTAPANPAPGHDVAAVCVPSETAGVSCALTLKF
jgi:hypothetical protein